MAAARTRRTAKMIIMTRRLATRNPNRHTIRRDQLKMITEAVATSVPSAPRLSALCERFGEAYGRAYQTAATS
jgi:hypothetical protein